ncbi:MAG: sensor histidine kinase, partial [Gemmatimonadales bacterium]
MPSTQIGDTVTGASERESGTVGQDNTRQDRTMLALTAAARRVAGNWRNSGGDAASEQDVSRGLDALVEYLGDSSRNQKIPQHLKSVLGRRVLELLRAALVYEWCNGAEIPESREILGLLAAMESLRVRIEPDWAEHFSSRLSGPDGLALVVEVAHDLRSPLTSILFLAETLQRGQSGDVNELQHRQLGLVYSAALGLSTVTSNVIELARGGNQLAEEEPSPFSVTDIIESVRDIVHPMAEEKGLTIRLLPPASDHRLGHPHALSRVLLNLTTNALKFTEEGFVEIVAREKNLRTLEFSVRDTGHGINPQALETLYLPFRRTRDGDRYAFSGTGLGLSLSRKLVEAMGSELKVET